MRDGRVRCFLPADLRYRPIKLTLCPISHLQKVSGPVYTEMELDSLGTRVPWTEVRSTSTVHSRNQTLAAQRHADKLRAPKAPVRFISL
jgi:hypothetical protein